MNSPLPPPLPIGDLQIQQARSPVLVSASNQSQGMQPSRSDGCSNLLSSQKFKDELALKQARLSPNPDSQLSIDDKIRQRKEAERSPIGVLGQVEYSSPLPDKLKSSSSLGRDKRPFAYSPDVNDPKNRGKLDLSQIKSANMRRRLIANMKESQEEEDSGPVRYDTQQTFKPTPITPEFVPITLLDTEVQHQQPIYDTQPRPVQRAKKEAPRSQIEASEKLEERNTPVSTFGTTIVHYKEPPTFYTLETDSCRECETQASSRRQPYGTCYIEALDAEVAESLDNLRNLANNLETDWGQTRSEHENYECEMNPCNYHISSHRQTGNSIHENHWPSQGSREQQREHLEPIEQLQSISTFLPRDQDRRQIQRTQEATTLAMDRQMPMFYSTFPSERQIDNFSSISNPSAASSSSSAPYSIEPFRSSLLDVDEHGPVSLSAVNNRPTSHRTFFGDRDSAITSQCHSIYRQEIGESSSRCLQPPTTAQHWQDMSREDQVREIRQMTEKLQSEVNRLYDLDFGLGNR